MNRNIVWAGNSCNNHTIIIKREKGIAASQKSEHCV